MIRSGDEYARGLRDGRTVLFNGERVADVTTHLAFAAIRPGSRSSQPRADDLPVA